MSVHLFVLKPQLLLIRLFLILNAKNYLSLILKTYSKFTLN